MQNNENTPVTSSPITLTQIKTKYKELLVSDADSQKIVSDFEKLLNIYREKKGNIDEKTGKELSLKMHELLNLVGLETHYPIAETLTNNRPLIIELSNELIKEYDCKTPTEKTLVHVIAGAYGRILEYSKIFNNFQRIDYISHEKNGYYNIISKELDRAQRHYITALTTLRQIKTPEIKVNVRANTAFVAQNQQLNNNSIPNENNNT